MARVCVACGNKIGVFADWQSTRNGCVCQNCYEKIVVYRKDVSSMTDEEITAAYSAVMDNEKAIANFSETSHIGNKLGYVAFFDDSAKKVLLPQKVVPVFEEQHFWEFSYKDIVSSELLRNEEHVQVNGFARAAAGALMFGAVGAVAGYASAQDARTRGTRDSISVSVNVLNYPANSYRVLIFEGGTECSDSSFETYFGYGQNLVEKLNEISGYSPVETPKSNGSPTVGAADEIRKFKALLDDGIISEDEFQLKKQQLLGI